MWPAEPSARKSAGCVNRYRSTASMIRPRPLRGRLLEPRRRQPDARRPSSMSSGPLARSPTKRSAKRSFTSDRPGRRLDVTCRRSGRCRCGRRRRRRAFAQRTGRRPTGGSSPRNRGPRPRGGCRGSEAGVEVAKRERERRIQPLTSSALQPLEPRHGLVRSDHAPLGRPGRDQCHFGPNHVQYLRGPFRQAGHDFGDRDAGRHHPGEAGQHLDEPQPVDDITGPGAPSSRRHDPQPVPARPGHLRGKAGWHGLSSRPGDWAAGPAAAGRPGRVSRQLGLRRRRDPRPCRPVRRLQASW